MPVLYFTVSTLLSSNSNKLPFVKSTLFFIIKKENQINIDYIVLFISFRKYPRSCKCTEVGMTQETSSCVWAIGNL